MDVYKKLFDMYTNSISINEFIKSVTREINNPIALINENFQIIAYSDNNLYNDAFYDEAIKKGYWTLSFAKKIQDEFRDGSEYKIIDFINNHRRLFIKLKYNERFIGYCVVLEINKKIEDIDHDFLRAATIIFAKSLYTFDPISKDLNNETFLINLINHLYQNRQIYLERLKRTNISQNDCSHLLLFDVSGIKDTKEDIFLGKIRLIYGKFILSFKDNYLIAFTNEDLSEDVLNKLDNVLFTYKIVGIMSSHILDLYRLDEIYKLNLKLLMTIRNSVNEYKLYDEERYKIILPFLGIDKNLLFSFINYKISKVYQYDTLNGTNFIDTIYVYLINDHSLSEASKILYLHKNTVLYRLDRIKELFGINFDSTKEKAAYLYSIVLLYYLLNKVNKIVS